MKILQISGSGRNSGKTTLGCALIQAFPHLRWSALKLTPHAHADMRSPDSAPPSKDTDRFLAAGAVAAQLLDAPLSHSLLVAHEPTADVLLVESGQPIPKTPWPLLHLAIAPSAASASWKPEFIARLAASANEPHHSRFDALLLHGEANAEIPRCIPPRLTMFRQSNPALLTPLLLAFVANFLAMENRMLQQTARG